MSDVTVTLDRKRCRRKHWVSVSTEPISDNYAILTIETRLKRPDPIYCQTVKGSLEIEFWAGDDSYLDGKKVEQGSNQTKIRIKSLGGWSSEMHDSGRYYIRILIKWENREGER